MSPIIRGVIILFVIFINGMVFFFMRKRKENIAQRCYTFLCLQSIFFPIIDLSMNMFGSPHTCLGVSSLLFVIINFDIFRNINWRSQKLILALITIMIVSALLSMNIVNSLSSIPGYLIGFIVYFAAYIAFSSEDFSHKEAIIRLFKLPIIYIILWGVIQIFITPKFSLYYSFWFKEVRVSSCFLEPQVAGTAIAILFILEWNYFQNSRNNSAMLICFFLFCIGCFTGSKSFFMGISVAILISSFWNKYKSKLLVSGCLSIIIAIIFFDYWIDFPVFDRLLKIDKSLVYRQNVYWAYAIDIFRNNWLSGIGPGNFESYMESAKLPLQHFIEGKYVYASQPESGYLLWLDEYGIMSIIWLFLIGYVFTRKVNPVINISLLIPWVIGFVSVYNFISMHIVFLVFLIVGIIIKSDNIEVNHN